MNDKAFPAYLSTIWRRAGLGDEAQYAKVNPRIASITDDSRAVGPESLFVAVRGLAADGHAFVREALARGAAAAVVEKSWREAKALGAHAPILRVEDTRIVLARLAALMADAQSWRKEGFDLVGVTGTNGKTTTAFLIRSILRAAGRRPALLGTVEYDLIGERRSAHLTTPGALELSRLLTAAREHGADCAVMEVSSHSLKQHRVDGLPFRAGIFTNLSGDHLDYHTDWNDYLTSKKRLFDMLEPGDAAVVNADDAASEAVASGTRARLRRYGVGSNADFRAENVSLGGDGTRFDLCTEGRRRVPVHTALIGLHNVSNILAAAACAEGIGVPIDGIPEGIAKLSLVPGRLQRVDDGGLGIGVYVDYAHTDAALDNVLSILRRLTQGRLLCVFGCGGDRDRSKRPRMAAAVERWADLAFLTSDNPRTEDPTRIIEDAAKGFGTAYGATSVVIEPDRRVSIERAINLAQPGDIVVIAGKGHEDYQLIGGERLHFDDVEEARSPIQRRAAALGVESHSTAA